MAKRKNTTSQSSLTSGVAGSLPPSPVDGDSERRRRRPIVGELGEPAQKLTQMAQARSLAPQTVREPAAEHSSSRPNGELDAQRPPLRPETKVEERAQYPGRLERWEAAKAVADSRKGHEKEDAAHRTTCELGCDHPAHILPRREWPAHTRHDLRHLECCDAEDIFDCPDLDRSHLLPPRPLDPAIEFCCARRCFHRSDDRSLTECPYLRQPVRARRQLELREFGKNAFTRQSTGGF
jgi:hypothetical protein